MTISKQSPLPLLSHTPSRQLDSKEIKRLNAEKLVVREIKIHSFLDHPNIIKLFGVFHDKHKIYLILEYAPDSELYSEIKNQVRLTSRSRSSERRSPATTFDR